MAESADDSHFLAKLVKRYVWDDVRYHYFPGIKHNGVKQYAHQTTEQIFGFF